MDLVSPNPALEARPIPGLEKPGVHSRREGSPCFSSGGQGWECGRRIRHLPNPSPPSGPPVIEVLPAPSRWRPLARTRSGHTEPSLVSRRPRGGL